MKHLFVCSAGITRSQEAYKTNLIEKYRVNESKIRVIDIPDGHSRLESALRKLLDKVLVEKLDPLFQERY